MVFAAHLLYAAAISPYRENPLLMFIKAPYQMNAIIVVSNWSGAFVQASFMLTVTINLSNQYLPTTGLLRRPRPALHPKPLGTRHLLGHHRVHRHLRDRPHRHICSRGHPGVHAPLAVVVDQRAVHGCRRRHHCFVLPVLEPRAAEEVAFPKVGL